MSLWLVFLLLSAVFSFGWSLGSALGFQNGQRDAGGLAQLEADLARSIELHLNVPSTASPDGREPQPQSPLASRPAVSA